jgi:hypothetical protein
LPARIEDERGCKDARDWTMTHNEWKDIIESQIDNSPSEKNEDVNEFPLNSTLPNDGLLDSDCVSPERKLETFSEFADCQVLSSDTNAFSLQATQNYYPLVCFSISECLKETNIKGDDFNSDTNMIHCSLTEFSLKLDPSCRVFPSNLCRPSRILTPFLPPPILETVDYLSIQTNILYDPNVTLVSVSNDLNMCESTLPKRKPLPAIENLKNLLHIEFQGNIQEKKNFFLQDFFFGSRIKTSGISQLGSLQGTPPGITDRGGVCSIDFISI